MPRPYRVPWSPVLPMLGIAVRRLPDDGPAARHLDPVRGLAGASASLIYFAVRLPQLAAAPGRGEHGTPGMGARAGARPMTVTEVTRPVVVGFDGGLVRRGRAGAGAGVQPRRSGAPTDRRGGAPGAGGDQPGPGRRRVGRRPAPRGRGRSWTGARALAGPDGDGRVPDRSRRRRRRTGCTTWPRRSAPG